MEEVKEEGVEEEALKKGVEEEERWRRKRGGGGRGDGLREHRFDLLQTEINW